VLASVTRTKGDGFREWSEQEAISVFARSTADLGGTRFEFSGTYYDNPRAENTGALTAAELTRDATLPDPLNVTKASRKAVTHSQFALTVGREAGIYDFGASVFTGSRSLDNPLPFSVVGVERLASGASWRAGARFAGFAGLDALRLTAGMDAQWQRDDRANWENCSGLTDVTAQCPDLTIERGATRLDQRENVDGIGSYVRAEAELPARVFVSGAIRHDRVAFAVADRFITATNGDDSGERSMTATSPMAGIVWRVKPLLSLYGNWSRAFETPTITELTNQPDGRSGLNAVVAPQRTNTFEAGVSGWMGTRVQGELSVFTADVEDELVSFDVPNAPGRRAFRNAGQTSRRGIEAGARTFLSNIEAGTAYTWSRFRFVEYQVGDNNFAGNPIPGTPEHQLQLYATTRWRDAFATVESRMASHVSANDAATVSAAGYATWSLRGGYTLRTGRSAAIEAIAGIDNIFDRRYAQSVVTNATRERFFEPGLVRRAYVGMTVRAQR
jgi:iron complex outermembrane receptor protein